MSPIPDLHQVSDAVPHHQNAQQEALALHKFQQELLAINGKCNGTDEQVKANFKDFDFKKLNQRLHKETALQEHMHAVGVFKIDGHYDLVISDDRIKNQVGTVDPLTGKIDATFAVENKGGHKQLDGHAKGIKETTNEGTRVFTDATGNSREYDTACGNKVKIIGVDNEHKNIAIQHADGNCEAFIWNGKLYEHKVPNEKSGGWTVDHMQYKNVEVKNDGTVTAYPTQGYESVSIRAGGGSIKMFEGHPRRIEDQAGTRQFTWSGDTLESVSLYRPNQPVISLTRSSWDGNYYDANSNAYKVDCDKQTGTIAYTNAHAQKITITSEGLVVNEQL